MSRVRIIVDSPLGNVTVEQENVYDQRKSDGTPIGALETLAELLDSAVAKIANVYGIENH